jgi:hypothetical protein
MQQKNDSTQAKAAKKVRKTRNNRDYALLHFMFIRDEIAPLQRPRLGHLNKKLNDDQIDAPLEQVRPASAKGCREQLAEERTLNDRLIERLSAYELAIQRIDRIALHALSKFDDVQVGGRKPKLEVKEMAKEIATRHLQDKKKLPTWRELDYAVRHYFFKNDPQIFIEKVKKGMDSVEVARYRIDPNWSFWRTVDGLISERTLSSILTQLRNEIKKIKQKQF